MAGLAAAACSDIKTDHGHVPTEAELQAIKLNVTTSEEVLQTAGSPMVIDNLYAETWIYVDNQLQTRGGRAPRLSEQKVVALTFTEDGRVSRIDRLTMADAHDIAPSTETTEIYEGRLSIFDQLGRAFGRVDAQSIIRQDTPGRRFPQQ
ncbi:MAG: outer membrane protein assembly factor BamE [Rhodobacteraceae bacterium]|nr:outer membrane protein assembly factor BamE [Paracoccaceae bacterium]